MLEIILTLIFVAVTVIGVIVKVYPRKHLPPGPTGLPIIGYIHKLGHEALHITLNKLSKQYGDIISLQVGTRLLVILSSKGAIYEAFVKKAKLFSGRPDLTSFKISTQGKTGLVFSSINKQYQQNKVMTIRGFQHLFANKDLFDELMKKQIRKMTDLFDEFVSKDEVFNPCDQFAKIVPSIILSIVFGEDISYSDPEFVSIVESYKIAFENGESDDPADFFNYRIVRMLPNKRYKIRHECRTRNVSYTINKIKRYFECDKKKHSLLHSYFESFYRDLSLERINEEEIQEMGTMLADILGGGFDTVSATLSWAILYLLKQPDVAQYCREEIIKVTKDEELSVKHESLLPYFVATIHDVIRHSSVGPISIPRSTIQETKLREFHIPKDTMVFPNIWGVNHDPNEWERPEELHPQHFLSPEGEINVTAVKKIQTFSSGARKCPGEKLAFYEIFYVLGNVLRRYDIEIITPPEDMIPKRGLSLKPKCYTVLLKHY